MPGSSGQLSVMASLVLAVLGAMPDESVLAKACQIRLSLAPSGFATYCLQGTRFPSRRHPAGDRCS